LSANGSNDKRAAKIAAARALIERLCEIWPRCFFLYQRKRRPLKLGVHRDIAALDDAIAPRQLSSALRYYVGNRFYLAACREGADRIDLDGKPAGKVSAEEAANAAAILAGRNAKRQAKTNTVPVITGPKRLGLGDLKAAAKRRRQQFEMTRNSFGTNCENETREVI